MTKKLSKVSLIGCGAIGQILANNFLIADDFEGVALNCLDRNGGGAQGLSLKLENSRFLLDKTSFSCSFNSTENYPSIKESDIIVVTAGQPRTPDIKREDLLPINCKIIAEVGAKIKLYAPNALVIVVTNPLDQMVYLMSHILGPKQKVLGMTCIDGGRLLNYVSQKSSKLPIQGYVIGSHSDKMIIDWESVRDKNGNIIKLSKKQKLEIEKLTIESGTRINQLVGRSDDICTANSIFAMIKSLITGKTITASTNLVGNDISTTLGKFSIFEDVFSALPLKLIGDDIRVDKKYLSNLNPQLGTKLVEVLFRAQEANSNLLKLI
jgi:malate dehydrogenase